MKQLTLTEVEPDGEQCPTCGDCFDSERGKKIHHEMVHDESIAGVSVECAYCGVEIRRKPKDIKRSDNLFCSSECRNGWYSANLGGEGHPLKEDWVEIECEYCGDVFEVKPYREQTARFCNPGCRGGWKSENAYGHNSPQWEGGHRRDSLRYQIGPVSWSTIRRNWEYEECYKCGREEDLNIHHTIPLRCGGTHGEWNLMTLCTSCHGTVEQYTRQFTDDVIYKHEADNQQRPVQ